MDKLKYLLEELRASFWFIPSLLILLAVMAALAFVTLDHQLHYKPEGVLRLVFVSDATSARTILSSIATAMIGVTGTVFSITLVALTLASSQFGSRLLRNFRHDRINQVVLGVYVSTFIYCLLVLNSVSNGEDFAFVPVFSVLAAILVSVLNIFLLIIFIHHIATSIEADQVVANIAKNLSDNIKTLFPKPYEESSEDDHPDMKELRSSFPKQEEVRSGHSGYLQSIDHDLLVSIAKKREAIIILYHHPGDFIVNNGPICEWIAKSPCEEDTQRSISDAFIVGSSRTPYQDAEYAIHQMVEIAIRALSPGINDSYTAITCIDHLSNEMCYLATARFPSRLFYDEDDQLRLVTRELTFSGMLDAAFNQIRQCAGDNPAVLIRLMEAFITIHRCTQLSDRKKAISYHAEMVKSLADSRFAEVKDLQDLHERYRDISGSASQNS